MHLPVINANAWKVKCFWCFLQTWQNCACFLMCRKLLKYTLWQTWGCIPYTSGNGWWKDTAHKPYTACRPPNVEFGRFVFCGSTSFQNLFEQFFANRGSYPKIQQGKKPSLPNRWLKMRSICPNSATLRWHTNHLQTIHSFNLHSHLLSTQLCLIWLEMIYT